MLTKNPEKSEKIKLEAYTVVNTKRFDDALIEGEEAPVRIVYLKKNVAKKANVSLPKSAKGIFIDPTAPCQYKNDPLASQYIQWVGEWNVSVGQAGGNYFINEFQSTETEDVVTGDTTVLIGTYDKKLGFPAKFKGISATQFSVSIDSEVQIGKSCQLKYDKKTSELVTSFKTGAIDKAVNVVMDYLVEKDYVSTWTEN